MAIRTIFFDFDGVIADSVDVKTKAFHRLYLPCGSTIAQKVVMHHQANGGMSRFEKFKLYHKKYLDIELDQEGIEKLAQEFSILVMDGVIKAKDVPGIRTFLERYFRKLNLYVITGTPTAEMKIIVQKRELDKFFKGIYGSPKKKDFWTNYIINSDNLIRDEIIFLGDAMSDYRAAKSANIHFALREYDENRELFKGYDVLRFEDFYHFNSIFKEMQ